MSISDSKKISLVILGASGGVAQAFLVLLAKYRSMFSNIVLVDRNESIIHSSFVSHDILNYFFLKHNISDNNIFDLIKSLKEKYGSLILLDITDYDTEPILNACNYFGISYLNCSLNDSKADSLKDFLSKSHSFIKRFNNCPHVLGLGMNPGIINHLIIKGFMEEGLPSEFVEIEYDSGKPTDHIRLPFITWSKKQFLTEAIWDKTSFCGDDGKYIQLDKPAIFTLVDTREYIQPIKKLQSYPLGMLVAHDEIIIMSNQMEIPGKFIYAIHPESLKKLQWLTRSKKNVSEESVRVLRNDDNSRIEGSDFIGVWLNYEHKKVCYHVEMGHPEVKGSNATLYLVAIGVLAGLVTFMEKPVLDRGVFSVSILNNDNYIDIISRYISINKTVLN